MDDSEGTNLVVAWDADERNLILTFVDTSDSTEGYQYIIDIQTSYGLYKFLEKKFRKIVKVPLKIDR